MRIPYRPIYYKMKYLRFLLGYPLDSEVETRRTTAQSYCATFGFPGQKIKRKNGNEKLLIVLLKTLAAWTTVVE